MSSAEAPFGETVVNLKIEGSIVEVELNLCAVGTENPPLLS